MRTGKLNISRGYFRNDQRFEGPKPSLLSRVVEPPACSVGMEESAALLTHGQTVIDRLDALERLARLRSLDLLSEEEFATEKAFVLARRGDERAGLMGPQASTGFPLQSRGEVGPALASRLFSWQFLPIGLVAGLALSFGAQPQETIRFFDQALRLVGA